MVSMSKFCKASMIGFDGVNDVKGFNGWAAKQSCFDGVGGFEVSKVLMFCRSFRRLR